MDILHQILFALQWAVLTVWHSYYHTSHLWVKIAVPVIVGLLLFSLFVHVVLDGHTKGFIRNLIAFHKPNQLFNSQTTIKWFIGEDRDQTNTLFLTIFPGLLFLMIIAKYLVFLFFLRLIAMIFIVGLCVYLMYALIVYGYATLLVLITTIVMFNIFYFTQFGIGLPHFTPHMTGWFGITINSTNDDVNINLYLYVLVLIAAYYSLAKYVINFFWWRWCETPEILLQEENQSLPDNKAVCSNQMMNDSTDHYAIHQQLIGDLRLVGFSASAIELMMKEYAHDRLINLVHEIRKTPDLSGSPKAFMMHHLFGEGYDVEKK